MHMILLSVVLQAELLWLTPELNEVMEVCNVPQNMGNTSHFSSDVPPIFVPATLAWA